MRFPRVTLLLVIAASVALQPATARAAEPTPSEISVARRLFEEGKTAEEAGRWREAAEKFRSAAAIKDTPGIRFHLGHCEEERGALVEALVEYDRARELMDGGVKAVDVERLLPEARERVRAKVAQVTLRLPAGVQNASVSVDGKAISGSVLGVPLPINPGRHRVQATAPGRAPFEKELQLGAGEKRELLLQLAPSTTTPAAPAAAAPPATAPVASSSAPAPAPATREEVDTSVPTRTIVLVGEGSLLVAALSTGIYFTVSKGSAQDRMHEANERILQQVDADEAGTACSSSMKLDGCDQLEQARQDRETAATWAIAGFVGAGVSAAALGLTYLLWPGESTPVQPSVAVAPGGVNFGLSGRF